MSEKALKLFVNYRRADNLLFVENLRTHFMYRYGRENVFMDFDSIPPFTNFENFIREQVRGVDVVMMVIGPRWLELLAEKAAAGDPDYVLIELEEALKHGKVIAPVLIMDAAVPGENDLPPMLHPILKRNIPSIRPGRDILNNIDWLMDALESEVRKQGKQRSVQAKEAAAPQPSFNIHEAIGHFYEQEKSGNLPAALVWLEKISHSGAAIPGFFDIETYAAELQAQIKQQEEERRRREVAEYLYGFIRQMHHYQQPVSVIRGAFAELWQVYPNYDPDRLAEQYKDKPPAAVPRKQAAPKYVPPEKSAPKPVAQPATAPKSRGMSWVEAGCLILIVLAIGGFGLFQLMGGGDDNDATSEESRAAATEGYEATADYEATEDYEVAQIRVSSNAEWTPVSQTFNGVEMVQVPAGCFMMGSEDGDSDEKPVHEQCFDEPFWIDKTEVTRAMYAECVAAGECEETPDSDYSTQDNQPINRVTWFQARDYCEWRNARLPTEREWEYAARGPDNWIYPWGNDFDGDKVIYEDSPEYGDTKTAPVGSRPEGASWVGALNMSGNVWEWVSTIYDQDNFPYPYDENDGRESNSDINSYRVLRGGSIDVITNDVRAANRYRNVPTYVYNGNGFRCARSY